MTGIDIRVSNTIPPGLPSSSFQSFTIDYFDELLPFRTIFRFPESSQSLASTAFPGTTTIIYLVAKKGFKTVQFYSMNSTSLLQSGNKQTRKNNDRLVHYWPNVVRFSSSKKYLYTIAHFTISKLFLKR